MSHEGINNILNTLDIIRIEEIKKALNNIINKNIVFAEHSSKTDLCVKKIQKISKLVSLLSVKSSMIKVIYRNVPWENLEKLGEITLDEYNKFATNLDEDFRNLEKILSDIVKIETIKNTKNFEILCNKAQQGEDEHIQKIIEKEEKARAKENGKTLKKYQILHDLGYGNLKFTNEHTKVSGYTNIRKITEPKLDTDKQRKILSLIDKVKDIDLNDYEGQSALFGITMMIGEILKNISDQTKQKNQNVYFDSFKDFRNKIHDLDKTVKAQKLLKYIDDEKNIQIFEGIKTFLTTELENKLRNLIIVPVDDSTPIHTDYLLFRINCYSEDEIKTIIDIFTQIIPQDKREKEEVKIKLSIINDIISGKLPAYILHGKSDTFEKIAQIFFEDELTGDVNNKFFKKDKSGNLENLKGLIREALLKNHILSEDKECVINESNKLINLVKKIPKLTTQNISYEQEITCFKEFNDNFNSYKISPVKYTSYIEMQLKILTSILEKINNCHDENIDYEQLRTNYSKPTKHYSHLFYLMVAGQAIQNLVGKDDFLNYADPKLLIELDYLKWVRNCLMHDLEISEVGSIASFFNNDLIELNVKHHGSKAYDTVGYLKHLSPMIDKTLKNIKNKTDRTEDETLIINKNKLTKILDKAHSDDEFYITEFIWNKICEIDEETQEIEEIFGKYFELDEKICDFLNKNRSIDLGDIYTYNGDIISAAQKLNITLKGFFGQIVKNGFTRHKNSESGLFVECTDDENLFKFKKKLNKIIGYRLTVVNDNNLREYLQKQNRLDGYDQFMKEIDYSGFERTMKSMRLHSGIKIGNCLEALKDVFENDCNLNLIYEGYAPIHKVYHVNTKNMEILIKLLESGANPNIRDKRGETIAHYAAKENDVELLKLLKEKGADFNIRNLSKQTALDLTAEYYDYQKEAYDFLLQNTNIEIIEIIEKIRLAIKHQEINILEGYLNNLADKSILNQPTEEFITIGNIACGIGNLQIIELLEKHGCDLLIKIEDRYSSLECACDGDNADLNPQDRIKLITYLIDQVKLPITSYAIQNALYCDDINILKLLIEKGGDIEAQLLPNFTPLLLLINGTTVRGNNTMEKIKLLLEHNADILACDESVGNALHLAAERGHDQLINILIEHAKNHNMLEQLLQPSPDECWVCRGENAYEIAIKYENYETAKKLEAFFDHNRGDKTLVSNNDFKIIIANDISDDMDSELSGDNSA